MVYDESSVQQLPVREAKRSKANHVGRVESSRVESRPTSCKCSNVVLILLLVSKRTQIDGEAKVESFRGST